MSDSVKHSLIWATCIALIATCFLFDSIYGKATPRRTALQECAWDTRAHGSIFCVELAKTAARESQ